MEKQTSAQIITAPLGEEINFEVRNMFGIIFMVVRCNFDVIKHIHLADAYISSIPGVRKINSVEVDYNGGSYYFGLTKDHDPALIAQSIEKQFQTYFKTIDKNPIK